MDFVIGLIAVIWLAARRFNTPRPVRTYTKATRYFWGCAAYVAFGALVYASLYLLVARSPVDFQGYAALAVVALMAFAVRLPGASRLDRRVRESLQGAIGYPSEARRLAAALSVAPFLPDPAVRDEVKFVLQGRGYELDDDWLPVAEPVRELWFRAAALFQQVRGWERDARFGGFVGQARDEFDVLRQRFDQLSLKVVRVLETIERLGRLWVSANGDAEPAARTQTNDPSGEAQQRFGTDLRAIISRLLADLRQDLTFFNHNLCLFTARGILTECVWAGGRQRQFAKLGFALPTEGPSLKQVLACASVLACTFVFIAAVFLLFGARVWSGGVPDLPQELPRIAKIALIQVLAIGVAVVPKQLFGFANENLRGETPWGYVLGAGLMAALLALPLQVTYFLWFKGTLSDFAAMTSNARGIFSWLVLPFATATSLAFLIQDGRWARIDSPFRRRLADVLVLLGGLALALCAARGLQYLLTGRVWTLDAMVRNACLIAFLAVGIGSMIPDRFRRPWQRSGGRLQESAPTSLAHAAPSRVPFGAQA